MATSGRKTIKIEAPIIITSDGTPVWMDKEWAVDFFDWVGKTKLKIYIVDEGGQFLSQETDVSDCKFNVKLYPGFNYLIQTITGGYLNGKVRVSTLNLQKSDSICEDIIVEKIPTGRVVLKNIYYDFDNLKSLV